MDYTYAKATSGRNTLRRTGMELPNGDDLAFTYSSSAHDAVASRVSTVTLDIGGGAVTIAGYDYNGAGHLVGTDYPAIEVMSLQYGSTSGDYPDLDRFDRVTSSRWTKDLATDRDLYDLDITYDRNSNILRVEDHVHDGFDVAYTMDDLNRLTVADQGTWTGSAITSTTRTEDWTLDQVGNWDEYDLDEDGDATLELNETRGHTLANELTSRNINSTGPVEYEPEYDGAGHLVDDTEDYAFVWDAFGRLRQVKETGTGDLVAEYTYNGLSYRIGWHYDADVDGDVDGSDPWYRFVYDERWRIVATYRGSDSDPKEQFVHHAAGDSGYGTASYIDDVILRDRDDNSGWTSAADGTLEERVFHCQNWRHDVVALVDGNGAQVEMVRYSPYGVPFGLPAGDLDSDGDVDAADLTVFDALIAYDVRADLDLDGDYDATDRSTINANRGTSAGLGVLSQSGVASRRGMLSIDYTDSQLYYGRFSVTSPAQGRHLSDSFADLIRHRYMMQIAATSGGEWKLTFAPLIDGARVVGNCGGGHCAGRYNATIPRATDNEPVCGVSPRSLATALKVIQKVTFTADCHGGAAPSKLTFYELHVPLIPGGVPTVYKGPVDYFKQGECCDEAGRSEARGTARLFCDTNGTMTPGWVEGQIDLLSWWDCCPPHQISTNAFPHSMTAPIGWEEPLAQATRYAFFRWNCKNAGCNKRTATLICDERRRPQDLEP